MVHYIVMMRRALNRQWEVYPKVFSSSQDAHQKRSSLPPCYRVAVVKPVELEL